MCCLPTGNSLVQKVGYDSEILWRTACGGGGVLSLALQPPGRCTPSVFLLTCEALVTHGDPIQ